MTNPFMRKTDDNNQLSSVRFLHPLQSLSKKTSSAESIKNTAHSPKFLYSERLPGILPVESANQKMVSKN